MTSVIKTLSKYVTKCSYFVLIILQGPFTGKPDFFFYRAFIANTEIIKLSLFNIVPASSMHLRQRLTSA